MVNKSSIWRKKVAHHPSVVKRHQQSLKRHQRNVETKSRLRTLIKKARQLVDAKDSENASAQLRAVNKALDKAVSRGVIKRNTASRWMSRLASSAKRASA
jgi:small subunit ribosomal protein S20